MDGVAGFSVEAPPAVLEVEPAAVPRDLLDGGEIVVLAVKPSPWSVLFESFQWICAAGTLIALDLWFAGALSTALHLPVIEIAVTTAALRLGVALMQWVSRVYLLTNRRIVSIRGVFRPGLFACQLTKIIGSQVTAGPHEQLTRLGTIRFNTGDVNGDGSWHNIARPEEAHAHIRRAIEKAIDHQT